MVRQPRLSDVASSSNSEPPSEVPLPSPSPSRSGSPLPDRSELQWQHRSVATPSGPASMDGSRVASPVGSGPVSPNGSGAPSPAGSGPASACPSDVEGAAGSAMEARGTMVDHVEALRVAFAAWVPTRTRMEHDDAPDDTLFMCADVRGSNKKAKVFLKLKGERPHMTDTRLSLIDTYLVWGLQPHQVKSAWGRTSLSALSRLQYLVDQSPHCLDVDWTKQHGEWFWPIDQAWLDSADEKHGWSQSLVRLIIHRISNAYHHDHVALVAGSCVNPQPAGRYLAPPDWIGMWNRSRGLCSTCSNHIWIGYDPMTEDKPPDACRATVQRLDNSQIHLRSNCADVLICTRCNSTTHWVGAKRPRQRVASPVG